MVYIQFITILKKEGLLIITFASISKEIFHFNFMKNSRHFATFLRNNIKSIKNNSINEEVFNEKFTKMDLIDFVFIKLFWRFIKKNLMTNLLILLKILFNKKKEIYIKSICLIHNRLRSLCFLFSNTKINYFYYHAIFYVLLYYVYRIRRGIKKNFGQKLAYMSTLF